MWRRRRDGSRVEYPDDSAERIDFLDAKLRAEAPESCEAALERLFDDGGSGLIVYDNTQHGVALCARTGELFVRLPGGEPLVVETT